MIILGSGLAGCLAAMMFPNARLYEPSPGLPTHKALLRFRSEAISDLTGIPFRQVKIMKSIWNGAQHIAPNPRSANMYSKKVTGHISKRSIWNLEPECRYIAPENFHGLLLENIDSRITYSAMPKSINSNEFRYEYKDVTCKVGRVNSPIISTLPMHVNAKVCGAVFKKRNDEISHIYVSHLRIKDCDTYMTNYYPDDDTDVYRASITGDLLIVESMGEVDDYELEDVLESFGIPACDVEKEMINHEQKHGKLIYDESDIERCKSMVYTMTQQHNLYSLGRLALHRNIVLDDVYHDLTVIKRMLTKSDYERAKGL